MRGYPREKGYPCFLGLIRLTAADRCGMLKKTEAERNTAMKYPYLYCDIDGTLADKSVISQENGAALAKYRQAGGKLGLATGRVELITESYAKQLAVDLPCILYNGAAVYDFSRHTFLHTETVDTADVLAMMELGMGVYPQVSVEICPGGPTVLANPNGVEDEFITREQQPFVYGRAEDCERIIKLMFYGEPQQLKQVEAAILPAFGEKYRILFSQPVYLEVLPKAAGKESALAWISRNLHLPLEQICAMGDFDNDVEMIQMAGLGAAPADAPERVKKQADFISDAHDCHAAVRLVEYLMELE